MPYLMRKLPKQDLYRVYNAKTKEVHSYGTTLENAKKQITLLNMIDAGVPLQPLKKVSGKGVETDLFDNEKLGNPVSIPAINSIDVVLPTYMYKRLPDIKKKDGTTKPPQYRFRLVVPTTKARNLASRMKQNVVNLERKPVAEAVAEVEPQSLGDLPKLKQFSPADRAKIKEYYKQVKAEENKDKKDIPNQPTENLPRGFPLPCDNPKPKKVKEPKQPKQPKVVKPPKEKKPRGRPKKQQFKEIILQEGDVVFDDESSVSKLSSLAKDKTLSSSSKSSKSKSSSSKSSVSSESSVTTAKSSKKAPSVASSEKSEDIDVLELMARYRQNKAQREKEGLGIKNKILTKSIGMNSWIEHCKNFAAKKGIKYNEALKDPECKATYKKKVGLGKCGMGIVDEAAAAGYADQVLIADAYNQKNLGAQKKYISL